jgi:hypothetical protein
VTLAHRLYAAAGVYRLGRNTLVGKFGTRVPFSDFELGLTFPDEQFWGRAARAFWIRENPDARFILCRVYVARTLLSATVESALSSHGQECPRHTSNLAA